MKNTALLTVLISIAFIGCDTGLNETDTSDSSNETGAIAVTLPGDGVSTSAWNNSEVSPLATHYEILVYNDTHQISSGLLSSGGTHTVAAPAGTYDILVVAGTEFSTILGFGDATDVLVDAQTTTSVAIGLDTYSWTTNWPTSDVAAGTSFSVTVDLSFSTDKIWIDTSYGNARLEGDGLQDSVSFQWSEPTTGQFLGAATVMAPYSTGTFPITISGPGSWDLRIGANWHLDQLSDTYWSMPDPSYGGEPGIPSESLIYNEFAYDLTVTDNPNLGSLSVDMSWNPDQ